MSKFKFLKVIVRKKTNFVGDVWKVLDTDDCEAALLVAGQPVDN
jgi:hypothetical protein